MDQSRLYLLALHFVPGIGDQLIRQLVSYCGSAERVFTMPKGKLLKIPGIGEVTAEAIKKERPMEAAERELRLAEKNETQLIFYTDKNYPSRLKQVDDAPTVVYVQGNVNFENPKTIGIVGTRNATAYGRERVEELIEGLVSHQPLVVSGLAYGIDIHAHKTCLKHQLPTVGVMGSGVDVIYPSAHREVAKKMMGNGGVMTEQRFGTPPDAHNFPARNRIVAALCDALVVVEAAAQGGALITADLANSYNKDVFAFPGNIGQSHSAGCNNLIKSNKANLITGVADIEYLMNWNADRTLRPEPETSLEQFSPEEQEIIRMLMSHQRQLMIDDLSWKTGIALGRLASILLQLEFKGIVQSLPGKIYKLTL